MKVKELLKILVAEDLILYLKTENGDEIELENINGANYDNLVSQHYFVSEDYEGIEDIEKKEYNLKADYIIDFDQFNDCEVVELNTDSLFAQLTIRI